jgi:D-lyxose ketol-isomerase
VINKSEYESIAQKILMYYERVGIAITNEEKNRIEIADFGLNDIYNTGLQLITYVNTDRVCAKEMVLMPYQTCPEHKHPTRMELAGKEETFRCRYGTVYLYVEGEKIERPHCNPPCGSEQYYTVWKEIILTPGEQYTIYPDTLHWFQAGRLGAVISEFSTRSTDETDIFTDSRIIR